MGSDVQDILQGGGIHLDLRYVIQSDRSGNTFFQIGDTGNDPPYWSNSGGSPPQGGPPVGRYVTT